MRIRGLLLVTLLLLSALPPGRAMADWPERAVKMIVTFPPGTANDTAARTYADALSRKWGKPVVVENRAGAEGTIGVGSFVSTQDDHTLLYSVAASVSVAPLLVDRLPYDVDNDLLPIASTTSIILTLAVSNNLGVANIPQLIDALKANPEKFAWASGPTLPRYLFASFLKRHGLTMTYVAYRDAAQPQADLGEGRIQVLVTSLAASQSPVQAGKARYLAVLNSAHAPTRPDVKTARELGYAELEIDGLAGIFGGKSMPEALRERIAADVAAVSGEEDLRRRLEVGGQNVLSGTTAELKAGIAAQRAWIAEISRHIDVRATN